MEEFFLKKRTVSFEAWQAGLLLIAAIIGVIGFGAFVEHGASDPGRSGVIAKAALGIARLPADGVQVARHLFSYESPHITHEPSRFPGQRGFDLVNTEGFEGDLLVLSRYDFDAGRSVVELVDIASGKVIKRYEPSIKDINKRSELDPKLVRLDRDHNQRRYMITHPLLENDGGLVFDGMHTPLVKIDACSRIEWTVDGLFHHSIERGPNGNYWVPGRFAPSELKFMSPDFADDAVVEISPQGKILFEKSVGELLIENGMAHLVYNGGKYDLDPLHLNDVQPVFEDGPYWKRGDLFLSLRNRSAVILYRPSTDKIVWIKQGPWLAQHDVDVVSDHEISVFSNNTAEVSWGETVLGANEIIVYDFDADKAGSPFKKGFERRDIRTPSQGRARLLPNGEAFVEETDYGRLLVMNSEGDLRWRYVNRASDGNVYIVHWSRYLTAAEARPVREALAKTDCGRSVDMQNASSSSERAPKRLAQKRRPPGARGESVLRPAPAGPLKTNGEARK